MSSITPPPYGRRRCIQSQTSAGGEVLDQGVTNPRSVRLAEAERFALRVLNGGAARFDLVAKAILVSLLDARHVADGLARLGRVELGNVGDCEAVGEGVSDLRIHGVPGYGVYFVQKGHEQIILLADGDKSSRARDIELAKRLAREWGRLREVATVGGQKLPGVLARTRLCGECRQPD